MHSFEVVVRPSRWGLRVRSALICAGVVAIVLGVGAIAWLWLLHRSLIGSLDAATSARVDDIAAQLVGSGPADLSPGLFTTEGHIDVVQILDATGTVVRSSGGAPSGALIAVPDSAVTTGRSLGGEADLRASARTLDASSGTFTVLAATSGEPVEDTLKEVTIGIALCGPVVVLAAASATYTLVGRSLASVEAIRAHVASIGAERLAERVPVPVAQDEIARLAATMNAMLDRVQAGRDAQRRFVGDASHELRSPLATMIAALEVGRDHPDFVDRELIATTLLPEAERMRHLIEDLLTLAATDEHGLALRTTDVDLDDLAATAAALLRHHHPALHVTTDLHPVRLTGNQQALERVLRNLADNAATHSKSRVVLTTRATDRRALFIVDDDGPGIPISDRARVFERFVRLQDDRSRNSGGTGLGLAIVAQLVAAHHGSVTIEDGPHGGTRVVVELPIDQHPT
ncbi:sensor histidine kinase [Nocardia sp. NBC_00403]|uniref:sensor histidine kinase n=1 Tax=Nocardia sp. NBC_00403 TaxID=2975990 RepID=UPI002E1A9CFC